MDAKTETVVEGGQRKNMGIPGFDYTEWRRDNLERPGETTESFDRKAMEAYSLMNEMMEEYKQRMSAAH